MSGLNGFALRLMLAGILAAWAAGGPSSAQTQSAPPAAPPGSRGENFSAGKTPAQLFTSDCTGSGCHKSAQGLAKDRGRLGLSSFLREHYTNSRETAAALAGYLASLPGDSRGARPDRPPRGAGGAADPAKPAEAKPAESKPTEAKPADETLRPRRAVGTEREEAKPAEAKPVEAKPAARPQRGRQAIAGPSQTPAAEPAAPAAEASAPPPAPEPPPRPQWDIFD